MFSEMLRRIRSYLGHERGVAAIMLAMLMPMIIASAGIAVDLSVAYNAKNRLGNALDKAALAAASSSGLSENDLNTRFKAFFDANYPASKYGTPFNVAIVVSGSVMTATASAKVPTSFMTIFGINDLTIETTSQVVQTLAGVEAVLVLDTTGSMAGNNITALKTASKNFINIIFDSITDVKYLKIGIVPWSDSVNVGPYGLGKNPDDSMFENGAVFVSPPATDPFGVSPTSNIKYGSGFLDWAGCVVEPNAASISQDNSSPNWTMYRYPSTGSCQQYACYTYNCAQQGCSQYNCKTYQCQTYACSRYNCNSCCPTGTSFMGGSSCCPSGDVLSGGHCCQNGYTYQNGTGKCKKNNTNKNPDTLSTTSSADSSGMCTGSNSVCTGYGNICEQQGACSTYSTTQCQTYYTTQSQCAPGASYCAVPGNDENQAGCTSTAQTNYNQCVRYSTSPNTGCTSVPVIPMTNDKDALLAEINALPTANNTYSDVGMVWGWRLISHGFPFTEGVDSSDKTWSKTVILMTDGNNTINTVMSGEGKYGTTGTSTSTTDQNNKFAATCTAMKAQGIRVYTITFQSAINATTQQYYRQCATNTGMYFNAPTNADLTAAFQSIATQLSQLHLTK